MRPPKDPMEYWLQPSCREDIDRCLSCDAVDCPGFCPRPRAAKKTQTPTGHRKRGRYNLHIDSYAVAKILSRWGVTIGELSDTSGISVDLIYRALRGESLAQASIERLADALDTYPADITQERW